MAGVEKALSRILLPTCVASNSSHARLEKTLGIAGLLPRFSGRILSAENVREGKPAPDLCLQAAQAMGALVFRPHALRACGSSATPAA